MAKQKHYDQYEVVKYESRDDEHGGHIYVAVAAWEDLQDKQSNQGTEFDFDGQLVKARLANDFKVRYAAMGSRIITRIEKTRNGDVREGLTTQGRWLDMDDENTMLLPGEDWERETFARDTSAEAVECVLRYLARIAADAEYQAKIEQKPDRRGTTLNLQVGASGDDGEFSNPLGFDSRGTSERIGYTFEDKNMFFRFTGVSGLSGATIDAADLQLYREAGSGSGFVGKANFIKEESPAAPTNPATANNRTRTTANHTMPESMCGTPSGFKTLAVVASLQEIADNYDPSALLMYGEDNGSSSNKYMQVMTYDENTSNAAKLDIDYTAGGGGGGAAGSLMLGAMI